MGDAGVHDDAAVYVEDGMIEAVQATDARSATPTTASRALLGGATTSQGITLASAGGIRSYYEGLVRSAEQPDDPRLPSAGTNIANPSVGGGVAYLDRLSNHTCYLQHLAEGIDDTARGWFGRLRIDGAHLADHRLTVRDPLGCDWAPSGSKNVLGELKVAWLASEQMGGVFTPRAVGIGGAISASGEVTFAGGMQIDGEVLRVVPDFEQEDARAQIATLGHALASPPATCRSSWRRGCPASTA